MLAKFALFKVRKWFKIRTHQNTTKRMSIIFLWGTRIPWNSEILEIWVNPKKIKCKNKNKILWFLLWVFCYPKIITNNWSPQNSMWNCVVWDLAQCLHSISLIPFFITIMVLSSLKTTHTKSKQIRSKSVWFFFPLIHRNNQTSKAPKQTAKLWGTYAYKK